MNLSLERSCSAVFERYRQGSEGKLLKCVKKVAILRVATDEEGSNRQNVLSHRGIAASSDTVGILAMTSLGRLLGELSHVHCGPDQQSRTATGVD